MALPQQAEPLENPALEFVTRYRNDRLGFVRHVLKVEPVEWQAEALRALDEGRLRLSIRSGHGVGKTTLLSWVILHHLLFLCPCKIACTAPSAPQLDDALIPEVKKWFSELPPMLREPIEMSANRLYWRDRPNFFCSFRTAKDEKPEALQGIHEGNVLLIVDEASGVSDPIFDSGRSSMSTKGAITILTSNPTRRSGFFYKTQTEWAHRWWVKKVSCFDSPLADVDFITETREQYGEDHAAYFIRVLGEFPKAEEDTFIPYHLVESAINRDIAISDDQSVYWGLDIARSATRDASALAKRQGSVLLEPVQTWHLEDAMELVAYVKHEWDTLQKSDQPQYIFVDSIGMGGPVADRLRQLKMPAVDVNVSELPSVDTNYHRLRDDLWGAVRTWFNTRKVSIPKDEKLIAELTTPLLDHNRATGKMICEPKDKFRTRLGGSPDRADALCLTFAYEGSIAAGQNKNSNWQRSINEDVSTAWLV